MKYLVILLLSGCNYCTYGQDGYPVPPFNENRLFYIQHSDNHNTYVYEANIKNDNISADEPLDVYRIAYTEGGKRTPLTVVQRNLAFGMKTRLVSPNFYAMHLAASKNFMFYLNLTKASKPKVYVTVNNRKMYLERIFLKLREGSSGIKIKLDYALFYGKDFETGLNITEKTVPKE